jgi:hypothetical protein
MEPQLLCSYCKQQTISTQYYFCPNCGKQLRNKPLSTAIFRQILIYLLSFLLPPLGFWPAVKYLKQPDGKSRAIGFTAIILTMISIVISVWSYFYFMDILNKTINSNLNGNSLLDMYR